MRKQARTLDNYAEQLAQLTGVLTSLRKEAVLQLPVDAYSREQIQLFAEENVEKRRELLGMELGFLARAFDDLDQLLAEFTSSVPQPAYNTTAGDAERFLDWLEQEFFPTPEQQDHIACERARLGIQALGRQRRRDHLRFQELLSVSRQLARDLSRGGKLTVHLNPLRVWSRFHTLALLDEAAEAPADVLFFVVGQDTHTAVLDDEGRALIEELSALVPCKFKTWVAGSELAGEEKLRTLCIHLADMGLVAFS
jgi:hypothetical protein